MCVLNTRIENHKIIVSFFEENLIYWKIMNSFGDHKFHTQPCGRGKMLDFFFFFFFQFLYVLLDTTMYLYIHLYVPRYSHKIYLYAHLYCTLSNLSWNMTSQDFWIKVILSFRQVYWGYNINIWISPSFSVIYAQPCLSIPVVVFIT